MFRSCRYPILGIVCTENPVQSIEGHLYQHCSRWLAGCSHNLSEIMEPIEFMGRTFRTYPGSTSAHIFKTQHPASRDREHAAVVKVYCMPYQKRQVTGETAGGRPPCSKTESEVRNAEALCAEHGDGSCFACMLPAITQDGAGSTIAGLRFESSMSIQESQTRVD